MAHSELLRYLGYSGQELTPQLEARIDAMEERCREVARPAFVSRAFGPETLPLELPGNDIAEHLRGAVEVLLVAVTLGLGVDRELRRLSLTDPLDQVLFDAAATWAVERETDRVEAQVRADAAKRGLYCSWRFSPGYGDLPLDVQPALLAVLNASRRLGITLTPSNLMVPTKSVTAIIGLHPTPQPGLASSCAVCSLSEFCALRTRGVRCR
ncbi:MAG: vitamin B12 dependent-methionine synthase activation domain-containing protein [Coriobacteriales bacterium]|nr:vitamin B12 dependent-methionine synthase activation domain-containing protein [Coriobacteriales bacterium]